MKTIAWTLIGGILLCALVTWAIWGTHRRTPATAAVHPLDPEVANLKRQVSALTDTQASMRERIEELEGALASAEMALETARGNDAPTSGQEAQERDPTDREPTEDDLASTEAEEGAARQEKLHNALDAVFNPATSWDDKEKTWSEIKKAGMIDEAVAAFEARVQENPQNPDFHADLGYAYLQKVDTVSEFERGTWAVKADKSFDAALSVDEHHWVGRFLKATALSFWPPVTGKQGEAIRQFEILRGQQELGPPQEQFAQTYVFLGNLYQNRGESKKAQEIWRKGAELFPQNRELTEKTQETQLE